jgi:hypothetical protein
MSFYKIRSRRKLEVSRAYPPNRSIFCVHKSSYDAPLCTILETTVPGFPNRKSNNIPGASTPGVFFCNYHFSLRHAICEALRFIRILDNPDSNVANIKESTIFKGVVSPRGTLLCLHFFTTRRLGETRRCIKFMNTPVPNFRNRKKSVVFTWSLSKNNIFCIFHFFCET